MCFEAPQSPSIAFGNPAYSRAESKADEHPLKIGVVSVKKVFKDCKKSTMYREEAFAERDRLNAELERLTKEIEAGQAGLKALKAGSKEHLALTKEILEKQGSLQVQQEFYKQQSTLREYNWTKKLYEDILRETGEVAKQKGLDMVFEKDEIDLPALSINEIVLTISTHKLLYSGGCLDITDEIIARLDATIDD